MKKVDWIRKLTSRKFWAAVAGFATGLIVFIQNPTSDPKAVTGLIMSFAALVAYIIGEGLIDAAGAKADTYVITDGPEAHPPEAKPAE